MSCSGERWHGLCGATGHGHISADHDPHVSHLCVHLLQGGLRIWACGHLSHGSTAQWRSPRAGRLLCSALCGWLLSVDLRTVSFDVPPQEVLSKDSVTVTVDAVVYYRISDPLKAVIQVSNYSHSTRLLAATTLRNVLGTRNLSELLTERETISHTMQMSLDEATDPWGVKVERVEM